LIMCSAIMLGGAPVENVGVPTLSEW